MISNTCKYGIRALVFIAHHSKVQGKIGIKKISEELDIPTPFLGKILQMLSKTGYLKSYKGPNGGFEMGKDPHAITLYEIVVLIDGDGLFTKCIAGIRKCEDMNKPSCSIHEDFVVLRDQIKSLMVSKSIGDLADGFDNPELHIGF